MKERALRRKKRIRPGKTIETAVDLTHSDDEGGGESRHIEKIDLTRLDEEESDSGHTARSQPSLGTVTVDLTSSDLDSDDEEERAEPGMSGSWRSAKRPRFIIEN